MVEDQGQIISSVKYAEKCSNCGLCFVHCEKNGEPILVKKNPKKNGERVVSVDEKKCDACERCVKVCPEHNFEMVEKDGKVVAKVKDADKCRGDDHCVFVCEECDAIICK
ncbi:4Fe-4S binding protein [Candidatus Woesearchaeota archaeon]|nr:4Fe-4S binding protein [Candidatus Woesearchaeota archaeon]